MHKKLLVVTLVLLFLVMVSSMVSAYTVDRVLTQGIGLKSLLYADWQMDYFLPLNPEELDRGDYRFTANMGRIGIDSDDIPLLGGFNENFNNYFLALDTGISDNLSMRLSYDYAPIVDNNDFEATNKVYSAYFNYTMKNDKSLFFGYNRLDFGVDNKNDVSNKNDLEVDYYFIGFEKRGSFLSNNK